MLRLRTLTSTAPVSQKVFRRASPYYRPFRLCLRNAHDQATTPESDVYHGPLASTFRRLKIFSLFSLALTTSVSPLILIIESPLPDSARYALAATAVLTSGVSTGLVSWCGAPYVSSARKLDDGSAIELETKSLFLKSRFTKVYDPAFLVDTGRFFAKYELAERLSTSSAHKELASETPIEETVAETRDQAGALLGRWIVKWEGQEGHCRQVGKVNR